MTRGDEKWLNSWVRSPCVMSDFPSRITEEVAHRPWPMPDDHWALTQSWHDLLFAHWPVATDALRALVPPGLELDLFERQAWVGIVPFHMTNVAPRGVPPIPWVSSFPELNVRTYVTAGDKPGVYFFSLDAGSAVAVAVARTLFNLPYYSASMDVVMEDGWVNYTSRRVPGDGTPAIFSARYRPTGPIRAALPGSLEYFLTERYCLYTSDDPLHPRRLEIHHPPWALQAAEASFAMNSMADAAGIRLPPVTPVLQFAKRQDAIAWRPVTVSGR